MIKSIKEEDRVRHSQLVGSVSWGVNHTKIFLHLCRVYRDLGLDIIDVVSHVREGWFAKMIIARNKDEQDFDLGLLRNRISKVSKELEFLSNCFIVPDSARKSDSEANVVIVLQANNKTGLLADVLEILDHHNIDIIDIKILMDYAADSFALNLQVYIRKEEEGFFSDLEKVRSELHAFRKREGLETFSYMVHSSETFDFIEKIDFEKEV